MSRILLGVLLAVGGMFAWQELVDRSDVAAEQSGDAGSSPAGQAAERGSDLLDQLAARQPASAAPEVEASPKPTPPQGDFAQLGDAELPVRVDALVASDGGFLHTEAGRRLAERVTADLGALPAVERIVLSQRLLESVLRGAVSVDQRRARTLVDSLRRLHRRAAEIRFADPASLRGAIAVKVAPGEYLSTIARRIVREYGVKIEGTTLAVLNGIADPRKLRAGQALRVPIEPMRVVVSRAAFLLAVYVGDDLFRTWWVGHGRSGHETPATTFTVLEKIAKPDWHSPTGVVPWGHPDNPLGTHFIKFSHPTLSGFGLHGTWTPESIGTRSSLGCIRVTNDDVKTLFALLPRGATVEIR